MATTETEVEIKVTDLVSNVVRIAIEVIGEISFLRKHEIALQNLSR